MKQVFSASGADNTATLKTYLASNRSLQIADLYHLTLIGGAASRSAAGFFARWTDKDYPINSAYLNTVVPAPIAQNSVFFPQRLKRGSIESKIGFSVASMDLELFPNDATGVTKDFQGLTVVDSHLSLPPYRDAFSMLNDNSTVIETLRQACWRGELDNAYLFIYRAFMPTPGDTATLGVMALFTGWVKEVQATRLGVKFVVAAMTDMFTTTQIPTQIIENSDRGGQTYVFPSGNTFNVQTGSTTLKIITDGALQTPGSYTDGWLQYNYGSYLVRPPNTPVFRQIYTNTNVAGQNVFFLYEPLPVVPLTNAGTGDTASPTTQTALAAQGGANGQGFPFVPKPESAL